MFSYVNEIDSTNTYMKRHPEEFSHGDVLLAKCQTAGRGQLGHSFDCPSGGLYMSLYLDALHPAEEMPYVTVLAGVAVRRVLCRHISAEIKIKWINDLYVGDKKLCGILTEFVHRDIKNGVIIGIGLNVNSDDSLPEIATSLYRLTGQKSNIKKLSAELAAEIISLYENTSKSAIGAEMRLHLYHPSESMEEWFSRYNM